VNTLFTFILGVLVGWLIEWLIDYFYWRRRYGTREARHTPAPALADRVSRAASGEPRPAVEVIPDDLKVIKGIGPVIERKLNGAGVHTFEQLGGLTVGDLRRILGNTIERLADEESLLEQARDLARRK
jgi:predicted flap endonuclease-1-like 5' DNA nuclease